MNKIEEFLSETEVFYLATVDGTQPRVRPLGAHMEADGKVLFGIGQHKNVYKQLTVNPLCEIVACKPDGHWLRYTGKAVFETDPKYAEMMIKQAGLDGMYNEQTGLKLAMFHLEDATAVDIPLMGEGKKLME